MKKIPVPIASTANAPRTEVRKKGNVIEAIYVYCDCGKTVQIKCDYQQEPATKPANT